MTAVSALQEGQGGCVGNSRAVLQCPDKQWAVASGWLFAWPNLSILRKSSGMQTAWEMASGTEGVLLVRKRSVLQAPEQDFRYHRLICCLNECVITSQLSSMGMFWSSKGRIRPFSSCQVSSPFLYVCMCRHAEMCSADTVALGAL